MTAEVWASERHPIQEWQESSSDSDVLLMDTQSEKVNLTTARSCHQEKQCTKVGWQRRGSESRQEKSENEKLLCTDGRKFLCKVAIITESPSAT